MNKKRYFLNHDCNNAWLEENHFFWSQPHNMYIRRFNVWRISDIEAAYGEIRLDPETRYIEFDVYINTKTYYGPYYHAEWGLTDPANPDVATLSKRIKDEFYRLGIEEDKSRKLPDPNIKHMEYYGGK